MSLTQAVEDFGHVGVAAAAADLDLLDACGAGAAPGPEGLDLKIFCEARPGLILWVLINTSFAYVQYEKYGFVSTSMILVWIFQMFYIVDYFWNEEAILTTMDIKHENFGFMLAFGDLCWVPMTYSLQAHYLIDRVHSLPWWGAALIVAGVRASLRGLLEAQDAVVALARGAAPVGVVRHEPQRPVRGSGDRAEPSQLTGEECAGFAGAAPAEAVRSLGRRIVLENCGEIDPRSLDEYRRRGGYEQLARCLELLPVGHHERAMDANRLAETRFRTDAVGRWRRYEAETFYILADPDLLNNGGLGRGENARLMLHLLREMEADAGGVLVDETLHGFSLATSPTAALTRPPLVWITLHLVLLAAALLWLANGRFGTPPSPLRARRDGKAFLIANTASLLLVGRHHQHLLGRYLTQSVREAKSGREPQGNPAVGCRGRATRNPPTYSQGILK